MGILEQLQQAVGSGRSGQNIYRLPGDMLCHEGLLKLRQMDEKNHTEAPFSTGSNESGRSCSRSLPTRRNCFTWSCPFGSWNRRMRRDRRFSRYI